MEPITSDNPKIVISREWKHWWLFGINGFTVNENTPSQTFGISFSFVRGNKDSVTGLWELSNLSEDSRVVTIDDIFVFAADEAAKGNLLPAQAMESIVVLAASLAKSNKIID